jgi:uncharacterized membrane protein YphA (DoxX/SURF4 family)
MSKTDITASTAPGATSTVSQAFPFSILIARIVVGVIFLAHAWFKIDTLGMAGTSRPIQAGEPCGDIGVLT